MVIASRTGWTESYIRWHLPLSRGMAYYHAAMLLDGVAMRWPEDRQKAEDEFNQTKNKIRQREETRQRKLARNK